MKLFRPACLRATWFTIHTAVVCAALALLTIGCRVFDSGGETRRRHNSSLVDFLYPRGDHGRSTSPGTPTLTLPLKVGLAWVPEDCDGSGASLADGFGVAGSAGRFAVAVPLVETMLAGWLLSQAGLPSPSGKMTVAPARPQDRITVNADGTLSGRVRGVPFASETAHIAVIATGAQHSVREFVVAAAQVVGFDIEWRGHGVDETGIDRATGATLIRVDPRYFRPAEVDSLLGDAAKARSKVRPSRASCSIAGVRTSVEP